MEVFQYASKHNHRKLMDDVALIAIQNNHWNNKISLACNPPDLQEAWVRVFPLHSESRTKFCLLMQSRYNGHWHDLFADCYDEPPPVMHPGAIPSCRKWRRFRHEVTCKVRREIAIFSKFDDIIEGAKHYLKDCRHCGIRADRWTGRVQRHISIEERMTPFTTFLT